MADERVNQFYQGLTAWNIENRDPENESTENYQGFVDLVKSDLNLYAPLVLEALDSWGGKSMSGERSMAFAVDVLDLTLDYEIDNPGLAELEAHKKFEDYVNGIE